MSSSYLCLPSSKLPLVLLHSALGLGTELLLHLLDVSCNFATTSNVNIVAHLVVEHLAERRPGGMFAVQFHLGLDELPWEIFMGIFFDQLFDFLGRQSGVSVVEQLVVFVDKVEITVLDNRHLRARLGLDIIAVFGRTDISLGKRHVDSGGRVELSDVCAVGGRQGVHNCGVDWYSRWLGWRWLSIVRFVEKYLGWVRGIGVGAQICGIVAQIRVEGLRREFVQGQRSRLNRGQSGGL
ncbi:hypothetical protein V8F06_012656 [Rhypophila decipiens]